MQAFVPLNHCCLSCLTAAKCSFAFQRLYNERKTLYVALHAPPWKLLHIVSFDSYLDTSLTKIVKWTLMWRSMVEVMVSIGSFVTGCKWSKVTAQVPWRIKLMEVYYYNNIILHDDSNSISVMGTIPCRQSMYTTSTGTYYIYYRLWQCSKSVRVHAVG